MTEQPNLFDLCGTFTLNTASLRTGCSKSLLDWTGLVSSSLKANPITKTMICDPGFGRRRNQSTNGLYAVTGEFQVSSVSVKVDADYRENSMSD